LAKAKNTTPNPYRGKNQFGTWRVYTRNHIDGCPFSSSDNNQCGCPKWRYLRQKGHPKIEQACGTPSFAEACAEVMRIVKGWEPEIAAAREREQREKLQSVDIAEVLSHYYQALKGQRLSDGYIANVESLLGVVDEKTGRKYGNLLNWIDRLNCGKPDAAQVRKIGQLTRAVVEQWRASWTYNDLTAANRWSLVKTFFTWCLDTEKIEKHPCKGVARIQVVKGNRCGVFTDEQYRGIVAVTEMYAPDNTPAETRQNMPRRMLAFSELMRWGGMSIVDAVQWHAGLITDGVLTYRRHKTGEIAVVPLPDHVLQLLSDIPLERDSAGSGQVFMLKDIRLESVCATWRRRLMNVFKLAGITEVETELTRKTGERIAPHPHMLRDTFAVWHLTHGRTIDQVARMLGHSNSRTTEQAYAHWTAGRDSALIAAVRESHAKLSPITPGRVVSIQAGRAMAGAGH
jgi:integrase